MYVFNPAFGCYNPIKYVMLCYVMLSMPAFELFDAVCGKKYWHGQYRGYQFLCRCAV